MAKSINLDFSKFFPSDQSFVAIKARAQHGDDFYVNMSFGDGDNKVTYFINEYNTKEALKQMQTMLEGLEKTMEFVQKVALLPTVEADNPSWFETLIPVSKPDKKAGKKKVAAKK